MHPCDLTDFDAIDAMADEVLAQHGQVDVLINNAGRSIRRSVELSYDRFHDYERTMQLNYFAPVRLILRFLPGMRERKSGQVINISSIGVPTRTPRFGAYIASKAALDTLCDALQGEVHDDGVRFTTIYMALVRTPMIAPTTIYKRFPTLTPEEAGEIVADAIIFRPRRLSPPVGSIASFADAISPRIMDKVRNQAYKLFPDSKSAPRRQGAKEEEQETGRRRAARSPSSRAACTGSARSAASRRSWCGGGAGASAAWAARRSAPAWARRSGRARRCRRGGACATGRAVATGAVRAAGAAVAAGPVRRRRASWPACGACACACGLAGLASSSAWLRLRSGLGRGRRASAVAAVADGSPARRPRAAVARLLERARAEDHQEDEGADQQDRHSPSAVRFIRRSTRVILPLAASRQGSLRTGAMLLADLVADVLAELVGPPDAHLERQRRAQLALELRQAQLGGDHRAVGGLERAALALAADGDGGAAVRADVRGA